MGEVRRIHGWIPDHPMAAEAIRDPSGFLESFYSMGSDAPVDGLGGLTPRQHLEETYPNETKRAIAVAIMCINDQEIQDG